MLLDRYPDLPQRLNLGEDEIRPISYTQWEALLAIYHQPRTGIRLPPQDWLDCSEIRLRRISKPGLELG